ncbi:hypothetical protein IFR05_010403 [Cadophora sp. M221]|nr:hypothetical protein IFR05_010403 [Cadophora sp. M221]
MAEVVFGVVSSGFAVASLAIQLLEVSQKLHTFFDSLGDSSANVERIKDHLQLMQIIPASINDICNEHPNLKCGDAVVKSIALCTKSVCKLHDLTNGLELPKSHGGFHTRWLRVKSTLGERTLQKFEEQLRGDVMMLLLALQPFFHDVQVQNNKSLAHRFIGTSSSTGSQSQDSVTEGKSTTINQTGRSHPMDGAVHKPLSRDRRMELWSQLQDHEWSFGLDSSESIEALLSALGSSISSSLRKLIRSTVISVLYTSSNHRLYFPEETLLVNVRRRLRVIIPKISFQLQSSSLPWTVTAYSIIPCNSIIFELCIDGNLQAVKRILKSTRVSPFVINQHGENLLHTAARYAHSDLCEFLLRIGVDGSAYDDRLLTPLDHLVQKIRTCFAYPSQVVNTIRSLVELGHCQPLLPLTSNAVAFYRGPEEGFAWLFASDYAGVNLEERDSEGWTLLGDAAFNFGWWTEPCVDDPTATWQSSYLLKAAANPHRTSAAASLTPLDAFLRSCSRREIDHASKWLKVLKEAGINLHKYADEEQSLHGNEHFLKRTWDDEIWKWIPTKKRVVYRYGEETDELEIWVEDFDALSWFRHGRHDLDIFGLMTPRESLVRWRDLNAKDDVIIEKLIEEEIGGVAEQLEQSAGSQVSSVPSHLAPKQLFAALSAFLLFQLCLIIYLVLR